MTDKDKQLLLVDLCARLPYGVIIKEQYGDYININLYDAHLEHLIDRVSLGLDKLILRPMSSITNDEREILRNIDDFLEIFPEMYEVSGGYKTFDYLNSIHIDYRNLISLGLALPAPEGMYNCFKT